MQTPHHTNPPFRSINYRADPAVHTVSTRLRQAWLTSPSSSSTPDLATTIRALQAASPSQLSRMLNPNPNNNNLNTPLHTPLRDAVYHSWNHVFWDVARFLAAAVGHDVGHLHPPREGVFAVKYPRGNSDDEGEERVFGASVLVVPAFLGEEVVVRFEVGGEEEKKEEKKEKKEEEAVSGFEFDATATGGMYNGTEVYWIRKGERVRISLGGSYGSDRSGFAGVFVYGILCDCTPNTGESSETGKSESGRRKRKRDEVDEAGEPGPETVAE